MYGPTNGEMLAFLVVLLFIGAALGMCVERGAGCARQHIKVELR